MAHKDLDKINKSLKHFFTYFKDDNVLVIAEDNTSMPFAFIIHDSSQAKHHLLLSIAVDYPNSAKVAEVALTANKIRPIALSEQFFIAQTGHTYLGETAHYYHYLQKELPIEEVEPEKDSIH